MMTTLKRWLAIAAAVLVSTFAVATAAEQRAEAAVPPAPDCADQESGISIILRISFFYVVDGGAGEEPTMVLVVSNEALEKLRYGLKCRGSKPGLVRVDGTSLKMRLALYDEGRVISGYLLPSGQPVYVIAESRAAGKQPASAIHLQPLNRK